jgi:hypothetical protein
MRRHHYKAYGGSANHLKPAVVTPDALLRLENFSGNVAASKWFDVSNSNNDGTPADAGLLGDYVFDGVVDFVQLASTDPSTNFSADWTITFWYKRSLSVNKSTIIDTRNGSSGGYTILDNNGAAIGNYTVQLRNPNVGVADSFVGTDSNWHFGALVNDSGARITSYIDGEVFKTTATANAYQPGIAMLVGKGAFNFFTGSCDTVRSYPRMLSADEIKRDYYAGKLTHTLTPITENLVSQYLPSDMTTTSWSDVTGTNNMTGSVTAPPAFDGDDFYTIGNPADLQFTNNWSIEAWGSQNLDSSQGFERLVSRDDGSNRCFILSQNDTTGVAFAGIFVSGALLSVQSTTNYADGNYHHYVVTHDGSNLRS